jgi:hypothetical protein
VFSVTTRASGRRLADQVDRDVDGDLLALAHLDEVDVLDEALDRVGLDLLGERQVLVALDVEVEQRVGAAVLDRQHRLVAGQGHVDRVVAVAVDDGGHLVGAADAAGRALAELGAGLGLDLGLVGHAVDLLVKRCVRSCKTVVARDRDAKMHRARTARCITKIPTASITERPITGRSLAEATHES